MYVKCGAYAKAQQALKECSVRDMVMWNALIAGYAQHGQAEEALKCFDLMQPEGHSLDAITFTCALKACGIIGALSKGMQIHDKIISSSILEKDIVLVDALVDMYAKCGALEKSWQVLEDIPIQDVLTWNALIAGYVQQGQGKDALKCFDSMQQEDHLPDAVSFTCALKACGGIGAAASGEQIHDNVIKVGLLKKNIVLGSALVDMYIRCSAVAKAHQVLEKLPVWDVVTWKQ